MIQSLLVSLLKLATSTERRYKFRTPAPLPPPKLDKARLVASYQGPLAFDQSVWNIVFWVATSVQFFFKSDILQVVTLLISQIAGVVG